MKLTLYMGMSLDGFIAKENDDVPWSEAVWQSYYDIAGGFKAIILGRRTYEMMEEANEWSKIGNPFTVVLSRASQASEGQKMFVTSADEAMTILHERGFNDVLVGGGAQINALFMESGLIDEIIIDMEPVIFGKGISLFGDVTLDGHLKLLEFKKLGEGTVQLHYEVCKNS